MICRWLLIDAIEALQATPSELKGSLGGFVLKN